MTEIKDYLDDLINRSDFSFLIKEVSDEEFARIYPTINVQDIFKNLGVQKAALASATTFGTDTEELEAQKIAYTSLMNEIELLPYCAEKKDFLKTIITYSFDITSKMIENPRERIYVKITKINPNAIIPQYAHPTDAGADVCAVEETKIEAGETKIVKTGLAMAIPAGYEIQVRPRSGLSLKSGLRIANAPGTIDSEYRGEVGIIITNTGETAYAIEKGMKIAQLVIAPTPMIQWEEVDTIDELGETSRGTGGFGSTGTTAS